MEVSSEWLVRVVIPAVPCIPQPRGLFQEPDSVAKYIEVKGKSPHALAEPGQSAGFLLVTPLSKPALNAPNIPVQLLGEPFQSLLIRMLCYGGENLFQNGIWLGNLWSIGLDVEGYGTWFGYESLEDEPHHEDAEGQGEGEVEVLRLREGGFLRVLQVCPGDIVRKPKPLIPEPG